MTHTPWILEEEMCVDEDGIYCMFIYGPEGIGFGRIATVYGDNCDREELRANARLIAAAPRLLLAVQGLLDYVEILIKERREIGLPDDHPDFEWPSVIEAKSAIAAAECKEE